MSFHVSVAFLPMQVLVTAQVIESSKGHPLLKDGIHVVSHEVEDESEWPGHSSHWTPPHPHSVTTNTIPTTNMIRTTKYNSYY